MAKNEVPAFSLLCDILLRMYRKALSDNKQIYIRESIQYCKTPRRHWSPSPNTTPLLFFLLLRIWLPLRLGIALLGFGIKLLGEQHLASQHREIGHYSVTCQVESWDKFVLSKSNFLAEWQQRHALDSRYCTTVQGIAYCTTHSTIHPKLPLGGRSFTRCPCPSGAGVIKTYTDSISIRASSVLYRMTVLL